MVDDFSSVDDDSQIYSDPEPSLSEQEGIPIEPLNDLGLSTDGENAADLFEVKVPDIDLSGVFAQYPPIEPGVPVVPEPPDEGPLDLEPQVEVRHEDPPPHTFQQDIQDIFDPPDEPLYPHTGIEDPDPTDLPDPTGIDGWFDGTT